jgi:hypothetical protein
MASGANLFGTPANLFGTPANPFGTPANPFGTPANFPGSPDWQEWLRRWPESFETEAVAGMERLVAGEGFAELLAHLAENVAAASRITGDVWDFVLRNLRLAGRGDIERLSRQLASTEEKLEQVLQAVEALQDRRPVG